MCGRVDGGFYAGQQLAKAEAGNERGNCQAHPRGSACGSLQGRDPDECGEEAQEQGFPELCSFESEFGLPSLRRKSNALGVWGQPCWPKEEAGALMVHPRGHQP